MPRQLNISATIPSGDTVYAVVSRVSDGHVFNTSLTTFEESTDANWADYAVTLTSLGAGRYQGNLPDSVQSIDDTYHVDYYQTAGTAAHADTKIGQQDIVWTDPTFVATDQYSLTSLIGLRQYMALSDDTYDVQLVSHINAATALIETACGRFFSARDVRVRYNGNAQYRLVLRPFPVIAVNRLGFGRFNAMSITATGSFIRATTGCTSTGLRLVSVNSAGVSATSDLSFAAYPTVSLLVAAVNAVSGWSATTLSNQPSADLDAKGGQDALNRTAFFTYPYFGMLDYDVDYQRGIVQYRRNAYWPDQGGWHNETLPQRMPDGFQNILVEYRAGYESIPADVAQVCRETAQDLYNLAASDSTKASVHVGQVSYTNRGPEEIRARIRGNLARYIDGAALAGGGN